MDRYVDANIIFSKFSRDYTRLKKELPIRPSEMGVLNIITKREGLFTPMMIAELIGVSKPMIAAHLASLEKKGYIFKNVSPVDKRSFYVMPTESAKVLVEEMDKKLNAHLQAMENAMGKDKFGVLMGLMQEAHSVIVQELKK